MDAWSTRGARLLAWTLLVLAGTLLTVQSYLESRRAWDGPRLAPRPEPASQTIVKRQPNFRQRAS